MLFGSDFPVINPERWLKDFAEAPFRDDTVAFLKQVRRDSPEQDRRFYPGVANRETNGQPVGIALERGLQVLDVVLLVHLIDQLHDDLQRGLVGGFGAGLDDVFRVLLVGF